MPHVYSLCVSLCAPCLRSISPCPYLWLQRSRWNHSHGEVHECSFLNVSIHHHFIGGLSSCIKKGHLRGRDTSTWLFKVLWYYTKAVQTNSLFGFLTQNFNYIYKSVNLVLDMLQSLCVWDAEHNLTLLMNLPSERRSNPSNPCRLWSLSCPSCVRSSHSVMFPLSWSRFCVSWVRAGR